MAESSRRHRAGGDQELSSFYCTSYSTGVGARVYEPIAPQGKPSGFSANTTATLGVNPDLKGEYTTSSSAIGGAGSASAAPQRLPALPLEHFAYTRGSLEGTSLSFGNKVEPDEPGPTCGRQPVYSETERMEFGEREKTSGFTAASAQTRIAPAPATIDDIENGEEEEEDDLGKPRKTRYQRMLRDRNAAEGTTTSSPAMRGDTAFTKYRTSKAPFKVGGEDPEEAFLRNASPLMLEKTRRRDPTLYDRATNPSQWATTSMAIGSTQAVTGVLPEIAGAQVAHPQEKKGAGSGWAANAVQTSVVGQQPPPQQQQKGRQGSSKAARSVDSEADMWTTSKEIDQQFPSKLPSLTPK